MYTSAAKSAHFGSIYVQDLNSNNPFLPVLCDLDVSQNVITTTGITTNIISAHSQPYITFLADVDVSMNTISAAVLRAADIRGLTEDASWLNFHTDLDVSQNAIRAGNLAVTTLTGATGPSDRITILSDIFAAATLNYTQLTGSPGSTVQAEHLTLLDADGATLSLQSTGITFPDKTVQTTAFTATDTLVAPGGLQTNAEVIIATATPGAAWIFNPDGTLTYPDASVQSTAYGPFLCQARSTLSEAVYPKSGEAFLTLKPTGLKGDLITVSYAVTMAGITAGELYVEVNGVKEVYSTSFFAQPADVRSTQSHTFTFQVVTTGEQNLALCGLGEPLAFTTVQMQAYRN
jgi:hypothetical protein